ncbi:MAG: restriction endonuclease [Pseudomonadota bacterium]
MALWLVRAGAHGEYEKKFLEENRIYLTWGGLSHDLAALKNRGQLRALLEKVYPDAPKGRITNNLGQIWGFSKGIKPGDWVVLPSKQKPAIHVAKVKGEYTFNPAGDDPFFHYCDVEWIVQDVPRSNFDQDLLYSFGAFMTVCQVSRNDAEQRVHKMAKNDWKPSVAVPSVLKKSDEEVADNSVGLEDLAQAARDQLAKLIIAKYKGHGMERLVDAVLRAQGYTTYLSPEGPDKGIDILAAPGPMGFGEPRICVQVKSGDSALDRPTLDQLIGVMQNVQASHGLLVSWGGFKSSIDKEEATQFFRVRLWDQGDLIDQVLAHYDKLDEEIRTELPLKRIWVVAEAVE